MGWVFHIQHFAFLCHVTLKKLPIIKPRRWRTELERSPRMRRVVCSNPGRRKNR